ncbi:trypsin-like peptidase domain-containing protein [Candidatus Woesearchaeota archaeon]|nr:trypsin-like peptidase domain-containing protein [Candidatus Woesearchaeota archaeon]
MKTKIAFAKMAAVLGLSATTAAGCGGMSNHARATMAFENRVNSSLEDISRSVHCTRIVAKYERVGSDDNLLPIKPEYTRYGTAFAFSQDNEYTYLLTAGHVVETEQHMKHWLFGEFELKSVKMTLVDNALDEKASDDVDVEVFAQYPGTDISVVRAKKKLHVSRAYKSVNQKSLHLGEQAYVIGYPRSLVGFLTVGHIGNTKGVTNFDELKDSCAVLADVRVAPGNSGSPLFVRRGDELYFAGVVTALEGPVAIAVGNPCVEARLPRAGY